MRKFILLLTTMIIAVGAIFFVGCDFQKYLHFMHKEYEWVVAQPATCFSDGVRYKQCASCPKAYDEEVIPKLNHQGGTATCSEKATCQFCGQKYGGILSHTWAGATCEVPKTCIYCSATEGSKLDHNYIEANCTAPKYCTMCYETWGSPLGHNFVAGTCARCNGSINSAACLHLRYSLHSSGDYYTVTGFEASLECDCEVVYIPNYYLEKTVANIGPSAFKDNHKIKKVVIVNGSTIVGRSAFEGCKYLESIVLSDVTASISNRAFYGCASLREIYIPSSVKMVGVDAFKNCTSLSIKCGASAQPTL